MNDEFENLAKELQNSFAQIDLLTSSHPNDGKTRLLLMKKQNIKIKIYQEKAHQNPHIHIDYGKQKHFASYEILTFKKIDGKLPSKYDKSIIKWLQSSQDIILSIWKKLQEGKDTFELIASLKA